jgi:hypothetical protein
MSQGNVETVRRRAEAFNRRDLDAFLALMDPEVEMVPILAKLEGAERNTYRGRAGRLVLFAALGVGGLAAVPLLASSKATSAWWYAFLAFSTALRVRGVRLHRGAAQLSDPSGRCADLDLANPRW